MKSFKSLAIAAILSHASVKAATNAVKWSYVANGADWPLIKASGFECHKTNQSPIDLRTDMHSQPFQVDNGQEFVGNYKNFEGAKVTNLGKTIQADFPKADQEINYFQSGYSKDILGGHEEFNSAQFHFHAKSEHTINGKRYDLEMHTVHVPKETSGSPVPIKYSAFGLMFDLDDYDKSVTPSERDAIDKFFDSLNLGNIPATIGAKGTVLDAKANVPFGSLMKIVDTSSRWVYTGSLTTPPCTVGVYFQVVDRVLPIKKKHYDLYLKQQRVTMQTAVITSNGNAHTETAISTARSLEETGNWRVTMPIDNQNVTYMRPSLPKDDEAASKKSLVVVAIFFALFVLTIIILLIVIRNFSKKIIEKEATMEEGGRREQPFQSIEMLSARTEKESPFNMLKATNEYQSNANNA